MGIDYSVFKFAKSNPVDDREDRKRTRRSAEDAARKAVWVRDRSRDRATGKPLKKGGVDPDTRGVCAHLHGRLVSPEMRDKAEGQILMSSSNHDKFDGRSAGRLRLFDAETGKRPDDARRKILFVFYDRTGKELPGKRRIS